MGCSECRAVGGKDEGLDQSCSKQRGASKGPVGGWSDGRGARRLRSPQGARAVALSTKIRPLGPCWMFSFLVPSANSPPRVLPSAPSLSLATEGPFFPGAEHSACAVHPVSVQCCVLSQAPALARGPPGLSQAWLPVNGGSKGPCAAPPARRGPCSESSLQPQLPFALLLYRCPWCCLRS